jgi:hypothetical protein
MDKPQKTLADYVAIAICPVLIMALVGSLVFFLLEIVYVGRYEGSLQYILFFFVFGAVLVSRISMGESAQRAPLYGLVLGLVTWIALLKFVEYPEDSPLAPWAWAINLGLIAVIWWSAHRLTWDCTLIDDEVDASGVGLMEVAGLEHRSGAQERQRAQAPETRSRAPALTWFQRYGRFREERKKQPHAPGVWVVYFSLAALPLFGLGQSQIPPEEANRRSYAFQLMCIYVGSGLGLLLATSFLGLRRYLRQRKLRMPAGITMAWLTLGGFLIALVLGFGALLPQPGAPYPLLEWTGLGSRHRETSRMAQVGRGNKSTKDHEGAKIKGKDKESEEKNGPVKKDGAGSKADKKDPEDAKGKDKEAGSKNGKDDREKSSGGKSQEKDKDNDKAETRRENTQPSSSGSNFLNNLVGILKWLVLGILILVILFVVLRSGLRWLANFTLWAQRLLAALSAWWNGLGALWKRHPTNEESIQEEKPLPPRPFSDFPDPFLYGDGETMPAAKLIRYSFEGLEAWAREHELSRGPQETPLEFAQRLGEEFSDLDKEVRRLAGYYAGLAYAGKTPPASCRAVVRRFWQTLVEVVEKPASAAR